VEVAELATIATVLTIGSAVVGAGAAVYGAYNSYEQGVAQREEMERQARIDERSAKGEYAAGQRDAEQRRREGRLIMSRQQALAAASGAGAGADDPTIMRIMSETGELSEYGATTTMYAAADRRDAYLSSATARRASGESNFMGGLLRAGGSLAGGIGNLANTSRDWIPAVQRLAGVA
jgi:hypothetical protein